MQLDVPKLLKESLLSHVESLKVSSPSLNVASFTVVEANIVAWKYCNMSGHFCSSRFISLSFIVIAVQVTREYELLVLHVRSGRLDNHPDWIAGIINKSVKNSVTAIVIRTQFGKRWHSVASSRRKNLVRLSFCCDNGFIEFIVSGDAAHSCKRVNVNGHSLSCVSARRIECPSHFANIR